MERISHSFGIVENTIKWGGTLHPFLHRRYFWQDGKSNIVMYMLIIWCGEADKYILRNFSL